MALYRTFRQQRSTGYPNVFRLEPADVAQQRYERCRTRLLDGRAEGKYLAQTERVGPDLPLLHGISFEQENIRWAERALTIIEHRQHCQGAGPVCQVVG